MRAVRLRATLFAAALAICLISAKPPQMVGDSGEYLVYALNFASLHGPSLKSSELDRLKQEVVEYAPELDQPDFYRNAIAGRGGRRDFMHFWFFSLCATPFVWMAQAAHVPPVYGFFGLNLAVVLLAIWVAVPRLGQAFTLLLFASPLIWWIDKAHTEVFTVGLIAVALLTIREKPWWAMVAAGAASTQYPHLAVLVVLAGGAAVLSDRRVVASRRFQTGMAAGIALAALHPAYYYVRHGTPSLLFNVSNTGMPGWAELSAVLFDPDIGLVASFPVFAIVVAAAVTLVARKRPRDLLTGEVIVSALLTGMLLIVCGRKDNVHHGATPSLSRYALWFIPLAIPVLRDSVELGGAVWRRFAWGAALVSALISVFAFHPIVVQNSREPTWLAEYLWTRHPTWNNPLPEVFSESFSRADEPYAPTFTDGCEKILIGIGVSGPAGAWPAPCFPAGVPMRCRSEGVWCYANRAGGEYLFTPAPGRWNPRPLPRPEVAWPAGTEPVVRRVYEEWGWTTLRQNTAVAWLRQHRNVHVIGLDGPDRFILVLRDPQPDAIVVFRLPRPMSGALIDAYTGQTITSLQFTGAAWDRWEVPVPPRSNLLLLALK